MVMDNVYDGVVEDVSKIDLMDGNANVVHHNGHGGNHYMRHVHGPRQIVWDDNRHGFFIP